MKMGELGTPSLIVDIHSNGKVEWRPIEVLKTSCPVDVARFPFDTQRCGLTFESTGYEHDEMEINIDGSEVELHEYKGTAGWIIKSAKFEKTAAHGHSEDANSEDGHNSDDGHEEDKMKRMGMKKIKMKRMGMKAKGMKKKEMKREATKRCTSFVG